MAISTTLTMPVKRVLKVHRHPMLESKLNLKNHVVIDRDLFDWIQKEYGSEIRYWDTEDVAETIRRARGD